MMTTGLVHPVADGEITDLKAFALSCSRGMMALVTLRDEPHDTPIPRRLEPNLAYYATRLEESQARLDQLAKETTAEREARVEGEYQAALSAAQAYDAKDAIEVDRIKAMRDKVAAWQGAPEGLKEFMLQQLDRSLEHTDYRSVDYVPRRYPDEDFRDAVDAVGRAHANIEREKALVAGRNLWLDQLWSSLDAITEEPAE